MLLKVEMPYFDRQVQTGSIVKWHKAEGDWIDFGDDLFDIKVEEITKLKRIKDGQAKTVDMVMATKRGLVFFIRATSSDMGYLRRIQAQEGAYQEIGDLVAIVTTEADEPVDTDEQTIAVAPAFRIIANVTEEYA